MSPEDVLECPQCPEVYYRGAFYMGEDYLPFKCLCGYSLEEEDCNVLKERVE